MNFRIPLGFFSCCLVSGSLFAQAIDLYVDTKTKQIYAEPGEGRVRMGSFERVPDKPAKPAGNESAGEPVAAAMEKSPEGGVLLRDVAHKPKVAGPEVGGFGFANWIMKDPFKYNL